MKQVGRQEASARRVSFQEGKEERPPMFSWSAVGRNCAGLGKCFRSASEATSFRVPSFGVFAATPRPCRRFYRGLFVAVWLFLGNRYTGAAAAGALLCLVLQGGVG